MRYATEPRTFTPSDTELLRNFARLILSPSMTGLGNLLGIW